MSTEMAYCIVSWIDHLKERGKEPYMAVAQRRVWSQLERRANGMAEGYHSKQIEFPAKFGN
jgi:hypothetical protein